jgi:glycosyltransferase involved in cell wall biosynthesis
MRILLLAVYYPPSTTSSAQLVHHLAREFARRGHFVTVLTPDAGVSVGQKVSEEGRVKVLRVKTADIKRANRVMRLWHESRLSRTIWRGIRDLIRDDPSDLIVFYSPTIFWGSLVQRLKTLWNCPSYMILRDMFPQWAVDAGLLREGSMIHRYLRRNELAQYRAADLIGVEAPGNLSHFSQPWAKSLRTEVLPNWANMAVDPSGNRDWRKRLGLESKVVFFYGGNIGVAQDMDNILRLATNLRDRDDIYFLLVGDGSEVARLNQEIGRLGLPNISIHAPLPEGEFLQCLSEADVGLVSLDRRLQSHNMPGKILSYMARSKPILASINLGNQLGEVLGGAAFVFVNGEDEKLKHAAILLAEQPAVRERMGSAARALGEKLFSVEAAASQILSHFELSASGKVMLSEHRV